MNQLISRVKRQWFESLEERAEIMLIALFNHLDNLFDGTDGYSEEKEQIAEKMITEVFTYITMLFDDTSEQAESA